LSPAQGFAAALALHRQGRLAAAAPLYEAVLLLDRHHVGSLHNLALIRLQQRRLAEAASLLRHAIDQEPAAATAHNNLGTVMRAMGRHAEAGAAFAAAARLAPELAPVHANLGAALLAQGRVAEALAPLERALTLAPNDVEAIDSMGNALQALHRPSDAVAWHERAIALEPGRAAAHNGLGNALCALQRFEEACAAFRRALAIDGELIDVRVNLGKALQARGCHEAAIAEFATALAGNPRDASARNDLAGALLQLGRDDEAIAHYRKAVVLEPGWAVLHGNLGNALHASGRHDEAIQHYGRAIALDPASATAQSNLGTALRELGRLDESRRAFAAAVTLAPDSPLFHLNLARAKRFSADDPQLGALEAMVAKGGAAAETYFALAKAHADLGRYESSFAHLRAANALKRGDVVYDEAVTLRRFERIGAAFTPALMEAQEGAGDPSSLPIFILGMPRSGTTLVEQIVASHPRVHGAGELAELTAAVAAWPAFPDRLRDAASAEFRALGERYVAALRRHAPAAPHITDKTPSHFLLVGLIRLALPNARIIHVRRDPRDTCLSCFATPFSAGQPYAYDLAELGRYYRAYDALMAHWRDLLPAGAMLEVRYEDVVADLAGEAPRIIAYCALAWDAACLDFHRNQRVVRTASAAEVREPIYRRSLGRWRDYGDALRPLLDALEG